MSAEPGAGHHERLIPKFISHLNKVMSLDQEVMRVVGRVAEARNLSFRTIERIATCVALARSFVPKNHLWISAIISVLCIMKIIAPEVFRRARDGRVTLDEIKAFLALDGSTKDIGGINTDWLVGWWKYCLSADEDRSDPESQPFRQHLFSYGIDREYIVPAMARYLDSFQSPPP